MREVITISLSTPMVRVVKKAVQEGDYLSTSEFFRDLLRNWQSNKIVNELKESREEILAGKGKILRSLKDLR